MSSSPHHFQQPALPLEPANDWTLRWRKGMHRWRHISEGGFDRRRYEVREIASDTEARRFIELHHYSHTYVAAKRRYGLYTGRDFTELVGVAVLSNPMNNKTLTNVFPHLAPLEESCELGRLVLLDEVEANAESFMMARVWELAARAVILPMVLQNLQNYASSNCLSDMAWASKRSRKGEQSEERAEIPVLLKFFCNTMLPHRFPLLTRASNVPRVLSFYAS